MNKIKKLLCSSVILEQYECEKERFIKALASYHSNDIYYQTKALKSLLSLLDDEESKRQSLQNLIMQKVPMYLYIINGKDINEYEVQAYDFGGIRSEYDQSFFTYRKIIDQSCKYVLYYKLCKGELVLGDGVFNNRLDAENFLKVG